MNLYVIYIYIIYIFLPFIYFYFPNVFNDESAIKNVSKIEVRT